MKTDQIFIKIKMLFNKHRLEIGFAMIILVVLIGIGAIAKGAAYSKEDLVITSQDSKSKNSSDALGISKSGDEKETAKEKVVFDIEGGIKNPGVYYLDKGSVIADGINAAGGFSREADRERIAREINQAAEIGSNSKIYIFTMKDREIKIVSGKSNQVYSSESSKDNSQNESSKININTADVSELDTLPGIGPAIAQRIIDWREANGGFEIIEDIKKVKGIGDSIFENIKDLIAVE